MCPTAHRGRPTSAIPSSATLSAPVGTAPPILSPFPSVSADINGRYPVRFVGGRGPEVGTISVHPLEKFRDVAAFLCDVMQVQRRDVAYILKTRRLEVKDDHSLFDRGWKPGEDVEIVVKLRGSASNGQNDPPLRDGSPLFDFSFDFSFSFPFGVQGSHKKDSDEKSDQKSYQEVDEDLVQKSHKESYNKDVDHEKSVVDKSHRDYKQYQDLNEKSHWDYKQHADPSQFFERRNFTPQDSANGGFRQRDFQMPHVVPSHVCECDLLKDDFRRLVREGIEPNPGWVCTIHHDCLSLPMLVLMMALLAPFVAPVHVVEDSLRCVHLLAFFMLLFDAISFSSLLRVTILRVLGFLSLFAPVALAVFGVLQSVESANYVERIPFNSPAVHGSALFMSCVSSVLPIIGALSSLFILSSPTQQKQSRTGAARGVRKSIRGLALKMVRARWYASMKLASAKACVLSDPHDSCLRLLGSECGDLHSRLIDRRCYAELLDRAARARRRRNSRRRKRTRTRQKWMHRHQSRHKGTQCDLGSDTDVALEDSVSVGCESPYTMSHDDCLHPGGRLNIFFVDSYGAHSVAAHEDWCMRRILSSLSEASGIPRSLLRVYHASRPLHEADPNCTAADYGIIGDVRVEISGFLRGAGKLLVRDVVSIIQDWTTGTVFDYEWQEADETHKRRATGIVLGRHSKDPKFIDVAYPDLPGYHGVVERFPPSNAAHYMVYSRGVLDDVLSPSDLAELSLDTSHGLACDVVESIVGSWDRDTEVELVWSSPEGPPWQPHGLVRRSRGRVIRRFPRKQGQGAKVEILLPTGSDVGTERLIVLPATSAELLVHDIRAENPILVRNAPKTPSERQAELFDASVSLDGADNDLQAIAMTSEVDKAVFQCAMREVLRQYDASDPKVRRSANSRVLHAMHSLMKHVLRTSDRSNKHMSVPPSRTQSASQGAGTEPRADGCVPPCPPLPPPRDRTLSKALKYATEGFFSRAARVLDAIQHVSRLSASEKADVLLGLHPRSDKLPRHAPSDIHNPKVGTIPSKELLEAVSQLANGASPGPSGLTVELIKLLVEDIVCRTALCKIVRDIINNDIEDSYRRRLVRCRIVGLPKPDDGVRPIAVGEALLKVAQHVVFNRYRRSIRKFFGDTQFGCFFEGGAETIVHNVRLGVMSGNCVLTIDAKNAFNSPERDEIAAELYARPEFKAFWRLFELEYGSPSELLFFDGGDLHSIITSESGTRQGSVPAGFYFCLLLQPHLLEMRRIFGNNVRIYAYMDDVTLVGADPQLLADAFLWLQQRLTPTKLLFNAKKCEFYGGLRKVPLPDKLARAGVTEVHGCIKVLGAYIGECGAFTHMLMAKLSKHSVFFHRLKAARPDTRTAAILATCGLPRQSYQLRVHPPEETGELALEFDRMVDEVLAAWFDVPDDDVVGQEVLHLPRSYGGAGFVRTFPTRAGSYKDSRYGALLALDKSLSDRERPPASKAAYDDLYYSGKIRELESIGPLVKRHLEENRRRGAGSWLFAASFVMSPSEYSTAMRARTLARSCKLPHRARCFGCRKEYEDQALFCVHTQGCASNPTGSNSNTKHNKVVRVWLDEMFRTALSSGKIFDYEIEPRDFGSYSCRRCHKTDITPDEIRAHMHECGGDPIHSGPDIEVHWTVSDRVVYDYTTLHLTCDSKLRCAPETSIKQVTAAKAAKYVTSGQIPHNEFKVVVGFGSGGVSDDLYELLRRLAAAINVPIESVTQQFAALIQQEQARAVIKAYRQREAGAALCGLEAASFG